MATTKKRVIIILSKPIEEDQIWNQVAAERDTKNARFVSHKKAWGMSTVKIFAIKHRSVVYETIKKRV